MNIGILSKHRWKLVLFALLLPPALVFHRALLAWFTGQPVGAAVSERVSTTAGSLTLDVALRPDPPRQKGNTLLLDVASGAASVEDAQIDVQYLMPAMGSMPEMRGDAEVSGEGDGRYAARFDLPMGGTWTIDVEVTSPKGSATASYSLTVGTKGLTPVGGAMGSGRAEGADAAAAPALEKTELPAPALTALQTALAAYEDVRDALASDTAPAQLAPRARRLGDALRQAQSTLGPDLKAFAECVEGGATAADAIATATDLEAARTAFAEVSRLLVAVAAADSRLAEGRSLFECPMQEDTFGMWIQASPELQNPYMGPRMLTCGSPVEWSKAVQSRAAATHEGHAHTLAEDGSGGSGIAYYTCSMHPSVKQAEPGTCPICSMDLTPVTTEEVESGIIFVDAQRRQLIGVKTGMVERVPLSVTIRPVGRVVYDETRLADVSLKYRGWIRTLHVAESGQRVKKGQTLFTIYSPELYTAQEDFLTAYRSRQATGARADYLVESARQRLRLWDLPGWQIDQLAERGKPWEAVPIVSPASGYVIEKNVVEGGTVEAGQRLYRIAQLDEVWVEAEVYESELPHVAVGQKAVVTLPYLPGKELEGRVSFVYPYLDGPTRTAKVRVELPNADMTLKPDMYANVMLSADLGQRLVVPESAVIYAGPRRLVFLDLGEGRLKPQQIEVGAKANGVIEVLSGLEAGDTVVTSANFLIAAESRLKSATEHWE